MADEEAAPPAKGKSKLLIIIIVVVALIAGGGAAAYFLLAPKLTQPEQAAETEGGAAPATKAESAATLGATYEMDPFIVNLTGDVNRYLKVVVVLQLSDKKVADEIVNRGPQIKDSIITLLSSKTADEIVTVQGKYDLKMEMVKRINTVLTSGVVRNLYFVEFVIQ